MGLKDIGANTRNWVDSTQNRDYWRALVNAAPNLRVSYAMELVNVTGLIRDLWSLSRGSPIFRIEFQQNSTQLNIQFHFMQFHSMFILFMFLKQDHLKSKGD